MAAPKKTLRQSWFRLWNDEGHRRNNSKRDERRCNADCGHRRNDELTTPPRRDHCRNMMRKRRHDLRFDMFWRAKSAGAFHLIVHVAPKFDVACGLALSNRGFRKLTVEPRVHRRR